MNSAILKPGTLGGDILEGQAEEIVQWAVGRIGNGGSVDLSRSPKVVKDAAKRLLARGALKGDLKRCYE